MNRRFAVTMAATSILVNGFMQISTASYLTLQKFILAKTACSIAYVDYNKLIHSCEKSCDRHSSLIDELLGSAARRSIAHIGILSRRTIREKLLMALDYFLDTAQKTEQKLPVSLSELADYICCDRSAMMRELKRLNDDKTIISRGNRITVLRSPEGLL